MGHSEWPKCRGGAVSLPDGNRLQLRPTTPVLMDRQAGERGCGHRKRAMETKQGNGAGEGRQSNKAGRQAAHASDQRCNPSLKYLAISKSERVVVGCLQMTTWTNRRGTESDREPTAIVDQLTAVVEVCSGALRVAKMLVVCWCLGVSAHRMHTAPVIGVSLPDPTSKLPTTQKKCMGQRLSANEP